MTTLALRPEPWTEQAVCATVDPELWFPEVGGNPADAIKICRTCPVISECLEAALKRNERFGVYGGLTERQRRKLR